MARCDQGRSWGSKMVKKFLTFSTFLLLVLICISVSSCIPKTTEAEPVVFSVLYNERATNPFQEDWLILEEYKSRQNVVLNVRSGDDATYNEILRRTLESGNIPDIVLKVWPNDINSYAVNGTLLPFSDYENLMPNFMAYIEENHLESALDQLRLDNGKYYILPGYQREIQVQQWIYRRDVFEQHDLGIPQTYDELFDALVYLKEIYPDSTPITAGWGGAHLFAMMGAGYEIPAGWAGTRSYNFEDDSWQFSPATENYRALYRFLNRCYAAGILDPEIFMQTDEDFMGKLVDGRALVTVTWITSGFDSWNARLRENGVPNGEWTPLPVPESTIGISALPPVDTFRKGLVVPARVITEPYFEDLLTFLDWAVYSEEGMTLTTWGVEGITFENTANGKVFLPSIRMPNNPDGTIDIETAYGLNTLFNLNENVAFEDYKKPSEIVAFLDTSLSARDAAEMSPQLSLNPNDVETISIIEEIILPYVAESGRAFITGELSIDDDWDDYILELERKGYETIENIWNSAWSEENNEPN